MRLHKLLLLVVITRVASRPINPRDLAQSKQGTNSLTEPNVISLSKTDDVIGLDDKTKDVIGLDDETGDIGANTYTTTKGVTTTLAPAPDRLSNNTSGVVTTSESLDDKSVSKLGSYCSKVKIAVCRQGELRGRFTYVCTERKYCRVDNEKLRCDLTDKNQAPEFEVRRAGNTNGGQDFDTLNGYAWKRPNFSPGNQWDMNEEWIYNRRNGWQSATESASNEWWFTIKGNGKYCADDRQTSDRGIRCNRDRENDWERFGLRKQFSEVTVPAAEHFDEDWRLTQTPMNRFWSMKGQGKGSQEYCGASGQFPAGNDDIVRCHRPLNHDRHDFMKATMMYFDLVGSC